MTTIPETLSAYDFQELIAFDAKTESEGWSYAAENYGPRFEFNNYQPLGWDDLRDLHNRERAAIADWWETHADDGCDLHNAHIDESNRRDDDRYLWAFRHENGAISGVKTEEGARQMCLEQSWRGTAVLHRAVEGGEWTVVEDFTGLECDSEVKCLRVGDSVLIDGAWLPVAAEGTEVVDAREQGGSMYTHVKYFTLSNGERLTPPYYWEDQPTVRIRRRTSVPEGVS